MGVAGRLVAWVPTPLAVYAAVYGSDGRLWFGGGSWFGGGFVGRVDPDGSTRWYRGGDRWSAAASDGDVDGPWNGPRYAATVSGLGLAGDGTQLALSLWSWCQRPHPAIVLDLTEAGPVQRVMHLPPPAPGRRGPTPTGILVADGYLAIRSIDVGPGAALTVVHEPTMTAEQHPALASRRLVVYDGGLATGWERKSLLLRGWGIDGFGPPQVVTGTEVIHQVEGWGQGATGLDDVTLGVREPPGGRVTAISVDLTGTQIITGADDGSIARWTVGSHGASLLDERPSHRFPVSAACRLPSGEMEATADRGGWVRLWRDGRLVSEWHVGDGRSPRTLAADPTSDRIAVGCKQERGSRTRRGGGVAVYELPRGAAGRSERATSM